MPQWCKSKTKLNSTKPHDAFSLDTLFFICFFFSKRKCLAKIVFVFFCSLRMSEGDTLGLSRPCSGQSVSMWVTACGAISCLAAQQSVRERGRGAGGEDQGRAMPGVELTEGYLEIALWPKYGSSNQSNSVCKLWPLLSDVSLRQDNLILTCHILYN